MNCWVSVARIRPFIHSATYRLMWFACPEPAQRCVLPYPGGSLRVLLYSIAELVVSSRVVPCPPGSGIG